MLTSAWWEENGQQNGEGGSDVSNNLSFTPVALLTGAHTVPRLCVAVKCVICKEKGSRFESAGHYWLPILFPIVALKKYNKSNNKQTMKQGLTQKDPAGQSWNTSDQSELIVHEVLTVFIIIFSFVETVAVIDRSMSLVIYTEDIAIGINCLFLCQQSVAQHADPAKKQTNEHIAIVCKCTDNLSFTGKATLTLSDCASVFIGWQLLLHFQTNPFCIVIHSPANTAKMHPEGKQIKFQLHHSHCEQSGLCQCHCPRQPCWPKDRITYSGPLEELAVNIPM